MFYNNNSNDRYQEPDETYARYPSQLPHVDAIYHGDNTQSQRYVEQSRGRSLSPQRAAAYPRPSSSSQPYPYEPTQNLLMFGDGMVDQYSENTGMSQQELLNKHHKERLRNEKQKNRSRKVHMPASLFPDSHPQEAYPTTLGVRDYQEPPQPQPKPKSSSKGSRVSLVRH